MDLEKGIGLILPWNCRVFEKSGVQVRNSVTTLDLPWCIFISFVSNRLAVRIGDMKINVKDR